MIEVEFILFERDFESNRFCNLTRFQELVYSENADIACVTETWLHKDIVNTEILPSEYIIIRKNRDSRAGGVLLAIKTSSFSSVREIDMQADIEVTLAEITTCSNLKLLVCCCYRPPNSDRSWLDSFNSLLAEIGEHNRNIIICGDFIFPNISWDSPERTRGVDEVLFMDLLSDYFLSQLVTSPTRGANLLDLVITSVPELVEIDAILQPEEAGLISDHCTITFTVKASIKALHKLNRYVFDYRRGDFDGLRSALQSLDLSNLIQDDGNIF